MIEKCLRKNNPAIALNILYIKEKEICPAYILKNNSNFEKQIVPLMIMNKEEGWHYLALKRPSALLGGITSKRYGDFHYLNCLHSFRTEDII